MQTAKGEGKRGKGRLGGAGIRSRDIAKLVWNLLFKS